MIGKEDVVYVALTKPELDACIDTAKHISGHVVDRKDLHARDDLERFINVLMGEVAEQMVIKWLKEQGKFAESAVDKTSNKPDVGHDVKVINRANGAELLCSVKSSLSYKLDVEGILSICKIASKESECKRKHNYALKTAFCFQITKPVLCFYKIEHFIQHSESSLICWMFCLNHTN